MKWLDWRSPYLVPLAFLAATRYAAHRSLPACFEDAYITFRFGRMFATGQGLVYNPGEWVMGFSSLPWTVLTSPFTVGGDPVIPVRLLAFAFDILALVAGVHLLDRFSRASAWAFALTFAGLSYFAAITMSGMETGAMAALVLAAAAWPGRWYGTAALAALAVWRPEGAFAAAVVALWHGRQGRLAALAAWVAVTAITWALYGSAVPQSLAAKAAVYGHPGPIAGAHWLNFLVPFHSTVTDGQLLEWLKLAILAGALGAAVLWRDWVKLPLAAAIAGLATIWAIYLLSGATYFSWYLYAPLLCAVLLMSLGFASAPPTTLAALLCCLFLVWDGSMQLFRGRSSAEVRLFAGAGTWLAQNAAPGDTVLAEPLGMIGWTAPVYMVDEVGLVSPQIAEWRAGAGWYARSLVHYRPRWLVVRKSALEAGTFAGRGAMWTSMRQRDDMLTDYEPQAGLEDLVILKRKDSH